MENLLTVAFEAHDAGQNRHRHYQVTVGRDLLRDWTVTIHYGRSGQRGREIRYADQEEPPMRAVIRERLHRRLSAPRRIGCAYRLTAFSAAPGFDAASWLPNEVMARFFAQAAAPSRIECSPVHSKAIPRKEKGDDVSDFFLWA